MTHHRILVAALAVLAVAILTPSASAHTTIIEPPGSHFPYQQWVDEAKVPTPDVVIDILEEECPGADAEPSLGCADREGTIWMNVPEIERDGFWPREIFYHELGHEFDFSEMTPPDRHRFRRLHHSSLPWFSDSEEWDLAETFAETYMSCAFDRPEYFRNTQASYSPRSCALIRRVGDS